MKRKLFKPVAWILSIATCLSTLSVSLPPAKASAEEAGKKSAIELPSCMPEGAEVLPLSLTDRSLTLVWSKPENYSESQKYSVYQNGTKIGDTASNEGAAANPYINRFYEEENALEPVKIQVHNYVVTGLSPSTEYRFEIRAVDAGGNERSMPGSYAISAKTKAAPKQVNVLEHGAKGDGTTKDTQAIQNAIDTCPEGGEVLLPSGHTFLTAPIKLKSNMTLRIDGTLKGSEDADDYEYPNPESVGKSEALIKNRNAKDENIRLVGSGTIDGSGWKEDTNAHDPNGFWVSKASSSSTVRENGLLAASQYQKAMETYGFSADDAYRTRSNLIEMSNVTNLYIGDGLTLRNPAQHTETNKACSNVVINGAKLETFNCNNGDGTGLVNGKGLIVVNSVLDTGDDCVAFNAGRGADDTKNPSTSDIWIFNNYFGRGHGAVTCGSYTAAWIEKILAEDNVLNGTGTGLRCKTSEGTGGGARSIIFRDTAMANLTDNGGQPFIFTGSYNGGTIDNPAEESPVFRDMRIENCSVSGSKGSAIQVEGLENAPDRNLNFSKITFRGTQPASISCLTDSEFHDVVFDGIHNPWGIERSSGLSFTGETTMTGVSKNAASAPEWDHRSNLEAVSVSDTKATLSWEQEDATDDTGVARFLLYQDDVAIASIDDSNTYTVAGLEPNHEYDFAVQAADATGAISEDGPELTVETTDLPSDLIYPPTKLRESPGSVTPDSVVLVWEKPLNYSNSTTYTVYRGTEKVSDTDKTFLKVSGLDPRTDYTFTVRANSEGGYQSAASNKLKVTTKPAGKIVNVRDCGAVGDGKAKDTEAIQKAIDACPTGGTVLLPKGVYLSGALFLHENMTFYVDGGAQLKPSAHLDDYPFTSARHDIEDLYDPDAPNQGNPAFASLLNAGTMDHEKDVTTEGIRIMGAGIIGDEQNGLDLREEYDSYTNKNQETHYGGGSLISLKNCGNVYLDGVHIRNGMMWTIVPVYCDGITAYGMDVDTTVHNGDGFNPNSSRNVYVLDTQFSTGDDCSAIKSGKDTEGIEIGRPSQNIYYRGDVFNAGHGGVTIGSEMSGGVSGVFVEDCTLIPVDVASGSVNSGIRIKVSPSRGGYIKNLRVRDSICNKVSVNTNYDHQSGPKPGVPLPDISNFQFMNVRAPGGSDQVLDLNGASFQDATSYLKNLQFTNCSFYQAQLNSCENIYFKNCAFEENAVQSNCLNIQNLDEITADPETGGGEEEPSQAVSEDFEDSETGETMPDGWTTGNSPGSGPISICEEDGNHYLNLTDTGSGKLTVDRSFDTQTGDITVKFRFRFNTLDGATNSVFRVMDSSKTRIVQMPLKVQKDGTATLMSEVYNSNHDKKLTEPILSGIEAGNWYSVKLVVYTDQKTVEFYDGDDLIRFKRNEFKNYYDQSDSSAAGVSVFEAYGPNNNNSQVSFDLDDFYSGEEEAVVCHEDFESCEPGTELTLSTDDDPGNTIENENGGKWILVGEAAADGKSAQVKEEDGNRYLSLTDNDHSSPKGQERAECRLDPLTGDVAVQFDFRVSSVGREVTNSVILLKNGTDSDTRHVIAQFPFKSRDGVCSLEMEHLDADGKKPLLPAFDNIEKDEWNTLTLAVHTTSQAVDVYCNDSPDPVLSDQPFYDIQNGSTAKAVTTLQVYTPNGNPGPITLDVDNFSVTSRFEAPQSEVSGVEVAAENDDEAQITEAGGSLQLLANIKPNSAADQSVTWKVLNPDLTKANIAEIDESGFLTAKKNGDCLAAAVSGSNDELMGILPIHITGQESPKGYSAVSLKTIPGAPPKIPAYLYQTFDNGAVRPVSVTWENPSVSQYTNVCSFRVNGTVTQSSDSVKASVAVENAAITSLVPAVVKAEPGSLKLPARVIARYSNHMASALPVTWDSVTPAKYENADIDGFRVLGTVHGTDLKAAALVSVLPKKPEGAGLILVAQDGTGDFISVGDALKAIPENNGQRKIIFIKNGIYHEKLNIKSPYITLEGQSTGGTRIVYDDCPMKPGFGTFNDYTVQINGHDFTAEHLSIENAAGSKIGQAVALDVCADRASFADCNIAAFQDTLLLRNQTDSSDTDNVPDQPTQRTNRSYFSGCTISGSVDYIFGAGKAVFDHCDIHTRLNGYVTAASTPEDQDYGFVFRDCTLSCESLLAQKHSTCLGRPWRPYSSVTYLNCKMYDHITPTGWNNWGNTSNEATARYAEYQSMDRNGEILSVSDRVSWSKQLIPEEAKQYTTTAVLSGPDNWSPDEMTIPAYEGTDLLSLQALYDLNSDAIQGSFGDSAWSRYQSALGEIQSLLARNQVSEEEANAATIKLANIISAMLASRPEPPDNGGSHHHHTDWQPDTPHHTSTPPVLQSDTTNPYQFQHNSVYYYKITTSDPNAPAAVSSNPTAVIVELVEKLPDGYLFRIVNVGLGTAVITTTAADGSATSFTVQANGLNLVSDTPDRYQMRQGATYQFKFTLTDPNLQPIFTTGDDRVFQTVSVRRIGNEYFYKVRAIAPGGAGVYVTLPGQTPVRKCVITVY